MFVYSIKGSFKWVDRAIRIGILISHQLVFIFLDETEE